MTGPGANGLIPRSKLFGNPERAMCRLSPDGQMLSWIAPKDGVLNIWVAPRNDINAAKCMTNDTSRGIRMYFWSRDASRLLYIQDRGGDEDWHVYSVDPQTGAEHDLTPGEKLTARIEAQSWDQPGVLLVGLNDRDAAWHDLYRIDINTGERELLILNDKAYSGFVIDSDLVPRLANRSLEDGGQQYVRLENGKEGDEFFRFGLDDAMTTGIFGFTADNATLHLISSVDRDTAAFIELDWASGRQTVIGADPQADISNLLIHPTTHAAEAYAVNRLRTKWHAIGDAVAADLDVLAQLPGEFSVVSRTKADDCWIVAQMAADDPGVFHFYDRKAKRLDRLFSTRPDLEGEALSAMHPVAIPARDGLELVSYLTMPAHVDGTRPDEPLPLVLLVHGGPWARDAYGYDPQHQWLADRGYAVLSVNYRGSTGFGKAFIKAATHEWAGRMHDDLLDAVDWAVNEGIARRDAVAIMGGSYGGYATLVGLTFTPDVFACGVDIVGPSNLRTLLETVPPYWKAFFEQLARRVGDPRTPEGLKLLEDRSPLNHVDRITRPLLIGQGANDPRVKQSESDQIVSAMQAKGIPVTYVLFPDEGHGFARPENRLAFFAIAEVFLSAHLGGACEPFGDAFDGATTQVPEGADQIAGLNEALPGPPV